MANHLEFPEDLNMMRAQISLSRTRSPFLSSIVHGNIPSNSVSKPDGILLSPLMKDTQSTIARERQALRSKSQVSFSLATETTPTMVSQSPFLKRQKTFESFLKSRDIELMVGEKNRLLQNASTLERHSSMDQSKPLQALSSIPPIDVKQTLKKKGGKMFTNELWSAGYYMNVLHKSNLKKKPHHQHTISMVLKSSPQKANELEIPSSTTIHSPKPKNNSYTLNITPCFDFTNQSIREKSQPREVEPIQLSSEASPVAHSKGQSVLRSILRNITPRKEALERNSSSPGSIISYKEVLTTDDSPTYVFSELNRNSKIHKPSQRLQNIHTSFEKKYEEDEKTDTTLEGLSPVSPTKARKIPPGKYLTRIAAKTNGSKTPCGSKNSLKNTRRDRNEVSEFLDASSTLRHHESLHYPSKSLHASTENIETLQKVQSLINQCIDLGQENKNLEKEVLNTQVGLEAYTKRKKLLKLQLRKQVEMSEDLQRKTQAIRVQRQRQGVM